MTDPVDQMGAIWPMGIPVTHTWREIGCLLWVIQAFKVKAFVELGVDQGGLAALLQARTPPLEYLGIELVRSKVHQRVHGVLEENALSATAVSEVAWWLAHRGTCLVYCDDGNKPVEVLMHAPSLRPGDILGVHDLGVEVLESHLPSGPAWDRICSPWLEGTRQAFIRRL